MDNASKALIMAGAILLAVAIVGLGVYFFSMSEGLTNDAADSITGLSTELQNSELLKYEGDKVKGSELRNLGRKIEVVSQDWAETITGKIGTKSYSKTADLVSALKAVGNNKVYKVEMSMGASGYVNSVTATQVGS